jgi:hypothetical protein
MDSDGRISTLYLMKIGKGVVGIFCFPSAFWRAEILVLMMEWFNEMRRLIKLKWHNTVISSTLHDNCTRHLNNIKVNAKTIWKVLFKFYIALIIQKS